MNEPSPQYFIPPPPRRTSSFSPLHAGLLAATVFTTLSAGAMLTGANILRDFASLKEGIPFAATLMAILAVHECGHYIASQRNRVKASLPYFIPAPNFIGTFGAFIKLLSPVPNRRALLVIGSAGPLWGFLVAVPLMAMGLTLSTVSEVPPPSGALSLGTSLLFEVLTRLSLGVSAWEHTIYLHPVALAGWFGLFVTALNLLPIGQSDGGHVLYAFAPHRYRLVMMVVIAALMGLGVLWYGWFIWVMLMLFLGFRHPRLLDEQTTLPSRSRWLGWAAWAVLAITFTPVPFSQS